MKVLLPKKKQKSQAVKVKITASVKKSKLKLKKRRCKWDPEALELAIESVNKGELSPMHQRYSISHVRH